MISQDKQVVRKINIEDSGKKKRDFDLLSPELEKLFLKDESTLAEEAFKNPTVFPVVYCSSR